MIWWKRPLDAKTNKIPTEDGIKQLSAEFSAQFKGSFSLDENQLQTLGTYQVPNLKNVDKILNYDDIVESFSKKHNCIASIFVKLVNDYIRIATTLKQRDGTSARGTLLDHFNPAYTQIQDGKSYFGSINLFGVEYLTRYEPIFDGHQQVIGILFTGLPGKSYRYLKENPW